MQRRRNRCRPLRESSKARLTWRVEAWTQKRTSVGHCAPHFRDHTAQAVYIHGIAGSRDDVCTPGHTNEGLVLVRDRAPRSPLSRRTRIWGAPERAVTTFYTGVTVAKAPRCLRNGNSHAQVQSTLVRMRHRSATMDFAVTYHSQDGRQKSLTRFTCMERSPDISGS